MSMTLIVEAAAWRAARLQTKLRRAARAALETIGRKGSLSLLLTDDAHIQVLNKQFRDKDAPTNVLSFPAAENGEAYLGDIAIAYGVTAREAEETGKSLAEHAMHLTVHGVLHLAGYDHIRPEDAAEMEKTEIAVLAGLGVADPYVLNFPRER